MKVRYGFISNSSSSSFTVPRQKERWVKLPDGKSSQTVYDLLLTEEQEHVLKNFGFYKENRSFDENLVGYIYDVSCNQDCVMKFLIDNKIPFTACCHYGQEHYFWDGKSENLIHLRNFGEEYSMYRRDAESMFKEPAGEYVPITVMTDCKCDHFDMCKTGRDDYK